MHIRLISMLVLACLAVAAQTPNQAQVQEFAPGIVSTGRGFTVTFAPDGKEVYFTSAAPTTSSGSRTFLHIYRSHFNAGHWQPAEAVAFSSDHWSDLDPFVTIDGKRMFFVSTRPAPGKDPSKRDMDIWFSVKSGDTWGEPHYVAEVNSTAKEGSPSLDRHNNLYFFSDRNRHPNQNSIYVSRWRDGHFAAPEKLPPPINSTASDTSPWIAPNGRTLLYYSDRPGGAGKADLYDSFLEHGKWSQPVNLGSTVNSSDSDYNPEVSRDGRTLFFGRHGCIYFVPLTALHASGLKASRFTG